LPVTTSSIPPAAAAKPAPAAVPPPASRPLAAPAAPRTRSAAPAAETAEHLRACAALDYANTRLSAQIIDLEDKVRQLQAAVGPQPAPAHKALVVPRLQVPVKPAAARVVAKKPATNWLLYGGLAGGATALLGAAVVILLRKRRAKGAVKQGAAAKKGALADLVAKLKRERAAPMAVTEPVLEPAPVEN
jgi:pilus assembly protein FimV